MQVYQSHFFYIATFITNQQFVQFDALISSVLFCKISIFKFLVCLFFRMLTFFLHSICQRRRMWGVGARARTPGRAPSDSGPALTTPPPIFGSYFTTSPSRFSDPPTSLFSSHEFYLCKLNYNERTLFPIQHSKITFVMLNNFFHVYKRQK